MLFPTEIYDAIAFYVEGRDPGNEVESRRYNELACGYRQRLATLRLVNKSFCSSASPQLFRYIIATFDSSRRVSPLVRLRELSNSLQAIYVHQIDVGFQPHENQGHTYHALYVEDLARLLPSCLVKLPNLKAIDFRGSPLSLPREKTNIFINTAVAALRCVPSLNLTELEIRFPTTYDFGKLFCSNASSLRVPIEDVLRGLRHLGLHVSAYTSHHGQRYWRQPVSPENSAFPNESHAIHLFNLVELAVNLDSLTICSTDLLDLDNVKFASLLRLKSLYLNRVAISSHKFLSLIEQSRESIRSVQLCLIQLNSGTWQHILLKMSKLPHLLEFYTDSSGYSLTGTSSHLALRLLPPPNNTTDIETKESLDIYALGNLLRHVQTNRIAAGLPQISEHDLRFRNQLPTLESVMEERNLAREGST